MIYILRANNQRAGKLDAARDDDRKAFEVLLSATGHQMKVLAGDFDAVVPPPELARLHEQMHQPLEDLAILFTRASRLLGANCGGARATGISCDETTLRAESSQQALRELSSMGAPLLAYSDARERAHRMLEEHGVTLPPMRAVE